MTYFLGLPAHSLSFQISTSCFTSLLPPPHWQLLLIGRTFLALQWLLLWTPASWDRPVQLTAAPPPGGPPAPPPRSGARAPRGGSPSRRRDTANPSWRARSQHEAVLYLLSSTAASKTQYLRNPPPPLNPTDSPETEPEGGVGIHPVAPADHRGTRTSSFFRRTWNVL